MNKDFTFKIIENSSIIFITFIIIGCLLIYIGHWQKYPLITALGGAIFGSSVTALISNLSNDSYLEQMKSVLEKNTHQMKGLIKESLFPEFTSEESEIKEYRKNITFIALQKWQVMKSFENVVFLILVSLILLEVLKQFAFIKIVEGLNIHTKLLLDLEGNV